MTLYFLNRMPQSWKDKYIYHWIAVAGPYAGAVPSVRGILSGYNFGIYLIPDNKALHFTRVTGSVYYLFPTYLWNNWTFISTPTKNYSFSNFAQLFNDANLTSDLHFYQLYANLTSKVEAPHVPVTCYYGYNVSTEESYKYDATFTYPTAIYGDGDGTVATFSATRSLAWKSQQNKSFEMFSVPNVPHVNLMQDNSVIKFALKTALSNSTQF